MRIALLTESTQSAARRGGSGWCGRLAAGLPEHEFDRYLLLPKPVSAEPGGASPGVRAFALGGPRPSGRLPGAVRRRQYARAYRELVAALVLPRERASFGPGLYRLAELAADGALPAFLASGQAHAALEELWRSPGADTAAGQPLLRDVLVAGDLLEQCLRPLAAPWYGDGPGGLGGADLCHVVGGGPAALPALVAKERYGMPFLLTEHGSHLREQYLGHRLGAGSSVPVRTLLLGYARLLAAETYRQAAVLTSGSAFDREWQLRGGAVPERSRVVRRGLPAVSRPAAGPEPDRPTLVWVGDLAPGTDPELMLHAFARVRAELPGTRLRMYGGEGRPGYRAHCRSVAARLGLGGGPEPAVRFEDRPERLAEAWAAGTVLVRTDRAPHGPRLLADAMLSGRALVATEVGLAREVVGPGGLLVPPGEPEALALACRALLADQERRARLGLAGRLRAQELFAPESEAAAFREVYLELVAHWPAFPAGGWRAGAPPRPFARPAEFWVAGSVASDAPLAEAR
ncbi:DUF3492 domain-containing protein [Kitasatospora sp. NPDC052896]|uniref:DUF3492 domain-containing protein n=1 Tax=Kitasatospora sp. NPDC052896 TaxID=3364061 RepID=UPI0037C5834C